jgi:DNA-binding PadR family transcriptional regulator
MDLKRKTLAAEDHLPLKPVQQLTLLLLAEGPTYGVALMEALEERSGGTIRLNAGSLYRLLASLVDDGLVEPAEEVANPAGAGAPRKLYALRDFGRAVLAAEARRQAELLEMARALNLLEGA